MIRKVISSCFAAYGHNIFGKKVEQSDLFVDLFSCSVSVSENMKYIFRVSPMICQRVSAWMTERYFLDKYSLFFSRFFVFSRSVPFFKFCRVVQSNLYSAKTAANGF